MRSARTVKLQKRLRTWLGGSGSTLDDGGGSTLIARWRRSPEFHRVARFLVVGVGNTIFSYAVYAAGVLIGLNSALALLVAMVVGVIFNFFTTGRIVFQSRNHRLLPRFIGVYVVIYGINVALLRLLQGVGLDPLLAQALCLPITVTLSFLAMRFWVFNAGEPARK